MQVASKARQLARVLRPPRLCKLEVVQFPSVEAPHSSHLWRRNHSTSSAENICSSGAIHGNCIPLASNHQQSILQFHTFSKASFSSEANAVECGTTEAVKELHDKMLKSVVNQRTAPANAWMWSLIENCSNHEDVKLLFDILQKLRIFRLSNLRIHENFNCALCQEITKACARVGAIEFGKKALWKHNVYGLTPTIGSAHHLLMYAKQQNDTKLMVDVMKLVKKNNLPLQPGTADIIFSICHNTDSWDLISKYSKKFVKAGVKLRKTSFDVWMQFAAKIGDVDSLWKIEKLRSESMKQPTLVSGFSCAKGFLLERKPENAAAIIQVLDQTLSDAKRAGIMVELQQLVGVWPLEVINRHKKEESKALAAALQNDIPAMVNGLLDMGLDVNVNMEDLTMKEAVLF